VAFVTAVVGNADHLSNLVQTYLSYPKQQVVITDQKPVPFPQVSICNLNAFSRSNLAHISDLPGTALYKWNNRLRRMVEKGLVTRDDMLKFQAPTLMLENIGINESRLVGHRVEDLVLRCTFRGRPCDMNNDFTQFLNPVMFNCYTFKPSNETGKFNSVGEEYGLSLILYLEVTNGTKTEAAYDYTSSTRNGIGARIVIHPQGALPIPHYWGLDIMPGQSSSISYTLQHILRLGEPYGACTADGMNQYSSASRYDSLVCIGECRQKIILDECNCKTSYEPLLLEPSYDRYSYCFQIPDGNDVDALMVQFNKVECLDHAWLNFERNETRQLACNCSPRCEEYKYPYILSQSKWPAAQYLESFLQYELGLREDRMHLKAYNQLREVCTF
jgi:hypothetical protein